MDRTNLPQEAVKINGQYIEDVLPGYYTITTSGREGLPAELSTYTVGVTDGETIKGGRYPVREITVEFALKGDSLENLRDKMENLANLLSLEEADFVFNDESDRYYTGRSLLQKEVNKYKNACTGTYIIYCAYPFKRSTNLKTLSSTDATGVVVGNSSATFTFNYEGTRPAHPVLRATFASAKEGGDYNEDGDCGYVAFLDDEENIIQLGNPDVLDYDVSTKNGTLINSEFTALTGWTTSNVATGNISDQYWNKGAGQTLSYAKFSGTSSMTRTITGTVSFDVDIVQRLCVTANNQTGKFEYLAKNGNDVIAGYRINKTGSGTTATVEYIVNGDVVGKDTLDVSQYNTNFGYCKRDPVYVQQTYYTTETRTVVKKNKKGKKKKTKKKVQVKHTRTVQNGWKYTQSNLCSSFSRDDSSITSRGDVFIFDIANLPTRTYKCADLNNITVTSIEMNASGNFNTNAVRSIDVIAKAGVPFAEIPNVFTSGDIVEADCNSANVMLYRSGSADGHLEPQYGALGNDWEDFEIKPGQNIIRAVWSDWVNTSYKPLIQIIFNEVYL